MNLRPPSKNPYSRNRYITLSSDSETEETHLNSTRKVKSDTDLANKSTFEDPKLSDHSNTDNSEHADPELIEMANLEPKLEQINQQANDYIDGKCK